MSESVPGEDRRRLSELLLQWEEQFEQGTDVAAADLCRDWPHLREPLEQQISQLRALQPLLETADDASHDTAGPPPPPAEPPLPPRVVTLSHYEVVRLHASGGKGQVHVARDRTLGRDVAVKCVQPEYAATSASSRRLMREAEITGRLKHPGIVPVFGVGQDDQDRPFYCMQLVSGDTLRQAIRDFHVQADNSDTHRRLRFRQLLRHFVDVCDTVAYAHSQQVIHRDIKPENIMLGAYGETFLVDWGLAKFAGDAEHAHDGLSADEDRRSEEFTREGSALGTPGYMSPEQARGEPIGPLSDIFNLGATLYTLLTGRRPYEGKNIVDVMHAAANAEFPTPRSLHRGVSPALDSICLRALAADSADRYEDAKELANDLERWLADEPVSVHRESLSQRLGRWSRRHRSLAASISIVLLVATVALAISTILITREKNKTETAWASSRKNYAAAEKQRKEAHLNFKRALAAVDKFYILVSENKLLNVPGLQPLRKELLTEALDYYESFLDEQQGDPELAREVANAHERVADVLQQIDSREAAVEHAEQAVAIRLRLANRTPRSSSAQLELVAARNQLSVLLMELGRSDEVHPPLAQALKLARATLAAADQPDALRVEMAKTLTQMGSLQMHNGQYEPALISYQDAVDLCRALRDRGEDAPLGDMWAILHYNTGNCERLRGRLDPALTAYWDAVREMERLSAKYDGVNDYPAQLADTLNQIAFIERGRENVPAAKKALDRSRQVLEGLVERDPEVHEYRSNLGVLYTELGRLVIDEDPDAAEKWLALAAKIREDLAAENPNDIEFRFNAGAAVCSLALLDMERRQFDSARDHFLKAVTTFQEMARIAPEEPQIRDGLACVYQKLGIVYHEMGELENARTVRSDALRIFNELLESHGSVLTETNATEVAVELAAGLEELGQVDAARDVLQQRTQELANSKSIDAAALEERRSLDEKVAALAQSLVAHEQYAAVLGTAEVRARLRRDDPDGLYECAVLAARCASDLESEGAAERALSEAIGWLKQSVASGLDDVQPAGN